MQTCSETILQDNNTGRRKGVGAGPESTQNTHTHTCTHSMPRSFTLADPHVLMAVFMAFCVAVIMRWYRLFLDLAQSPSSEVAPMPVATKPTRVELPALIRVRANAICGFEQAGFGDEGESRGEGLGDD